MSGAVPAEREGPPAGGWLALRGDDGVAFQAWHVPAARRMPGAPLGLVMLPEVYNLNPWARSAARRFAAEGAEVLLLDLYWREAPDLRLDYDDPVPARCRGAAVQAALVLADVAVAARALRQRLGAGARIATLGYCLGGRLALLARPLSDIDAAVSYYGVQLDSHLSAIAAGTAPALLHFGGADPWVPAATVSALQALAARAPASRLQVLLHAGADHGFARQGYAPWHAEADARAHRASLDFLAALPGTSS